MRLYIKCSRNTSPVDFNHQHLLTGVIHKWLGDNHEHGELSLYSFSILSGGKARNGKLEFDKGTSFFISSYDSSIQKRIIDGVQSSPNLFNGIEVEELVIQKTPDFSQIEYFQVASPIFIKRNIDDNIKHISYKDIAADEYLKETLITKMNAVGLSDDSLEISFVRDYRSAKEKLIKYRNVANKANWCPVIIKGKAETKAFAWEVGLGNSTGIGFGALK